MPYTGCRTAHYNLRVEQIDKDAGLEQHLFTIRKQYLDLYVVKDMDVYQERCMSYTSHIHEPGPTTKDLLVKVARQRDSNVTYHLLFIMSRSSIHRC